MYKRTSIFAGLFLMLVSACGGGGDSAFKYENTPENFQKFFTELQAAIRENNVEKAAALTKDVIPDRDRIKKALKDDAPAAVLEKMTAQYAKKPPDDNAWANALGPGNSARTQVKTYKATTEQLRACMTEKAPECEEFPGGAFDAALSVLRPGVTFYEAEVTEPGKDSGMKFHLFYWDGSKWTMLGPVWRAMR